MKYYVAFAENSLSGHPDEVEDVKEQVKETEAEVEKLRTELAQAKVSDLSSIQTVKPSS